MKDPQLQQLLKEQDTLNQQLKELLMDSEIDHIRSQNTDLLGKLETLEQKYKQTQSQFKEVTLQKNKYKQAFHELLFDQRNSLLKNNHKRLAALIYNNEQANLQSLQQLEKNITMQLQQLQHTIQKENLDTSIEIKKELTALTLKVNNQIRLQKQQVAEASKSLQLDTSKWHEEQAILPIDDELIKIEQQRVHTESRFGLKLFNYIGIFFIFLAVITLGTLTVTKMPDVIKGLLLFTFPTAALGAGYWLYRKEKQNFAIGLFGGSIGLYYIAIFTNYFILHTVESLFSFVLLLGVSLLSFVLALSYQKLSLSLIALIGGYFPIICYWNLIGFQAGTLYFAKLYVILLNLSFFYLFQRFKWDKLYLATFLLMTPWIYLFSSLGLHSTVENFMYGVLYAVLFVGYPLRALLKKRTLTTLETICFLLALANFSMLGISLFKANAHFTNLFILGTSLLLYALVYFVFIRFPQQQKDASAMQGGIFSAIAVYLYIIAVVYVPLVWLENWKISIINLFLLTFAYLILFTKQQKLIFYIIELIHHSFFYMALLISFFFGDLPVWLSGILLLGVLLHNLYLKKSLKQSGILGSSLHNLSVISFYLFCHLFVFQLVDLSYFTSFYKNHFPLFTWSLLAAWGLLALLAIKIPEAKRLYLPLISTVILSVVNFFMNFKGIREYNFFQLLPFVFANVIIFLLLFYFAKELLILGKITLSFFIISLTLIVLVNGTILAYRNFEFSYLTILVDILYGFVAIGYVLLGFKKTLPLIRKLGLVFMLIIMGKLLLLDISSATVISKVFAFFTFGGLALLISYLYQNALNRSKKILDTEEKTTEK